MSVTARLDGIEFIKRGLRSHAEKVVGDIAKRTPLHIINNITGKQTGIDEGMKLPVNAASTINRKLDEGKAPKSLIDEGQLTNQSNWRVTKMPGGYKVGLKEIRKQAVADLHNGIPRRGGTVKYIFLQLREGYLPNWIKTIIKAHVRSFFSRVK